MAVKTAAGGGTRALAPPFSDRSTPADRPHQVTLSRALLVASQDFGVACRTERLDHLEDAPADAGLADLVVSPHQLQRLSLDQRILFLLERCGGLAEVL